MPEQAYLRKGPGFVNCSEFIAAETLSLLWASPHCEWIDNETLEVRLEQPAQIANGTQIYLIGKKLFKKLTKDCQNSQNVLLTRT
jgi:hypothetical protein